MEMLKMAEYEFDGKAFRQFLNKKAWEIANKRECAPYAEGYKSPIDVVYADVKLQFDDNVMKAIQKVGIEVDKEELLKALNYDRMQYWNGFSNGAMAALSKIVHCGECKNCQHLKTRDELWCDGHTVYEEGFCAWGERMERSEDATN